MRESPTMPDTLNLPRWSMVGEMNNRHMEAMPDGHYFDAVQVLAHLDTLTAAVRALAADLVNDHRGIPYDVIERLDAILGEPHDV